MNVAEAFMELEKATKELGQVAIETRHKQEIMHDALIQAASYIFYVKNNFPKAHEYANGTPSIEQTVNNAIKKYDQ